MANNKFYGKLMATSDVAKRFKVTTTTVIRWANRGWLQYTDLSNGVERQFYGFREEDVAVFNPADHRGRPGRKPKTVKASKDFPCKEEPKTYTEEKLCDYAISRLAAVNIACLGNTNRDIVKGLAKLPKVGVVDETREEIAELKARVKELSEELFKVCVALEELSK